MSYEVIGIGEILWDVLPDGPRFGGAPANFGCSMAALAGSHARVRIVSALGDDDLGREALERLKQQNVSTDCVQLNQWPTGRVDVSLDGAGVASYQFAEDCAWDHLQWNDSLAACAAHCDAVCFGTLGQRSEASRATIGQFVQSTSPKALRILDVNLRAPFFSESVIVESLEIANVLKLNDDELPILASICGLTGSQAEQLDKIGRHYNLLSVALTRGANGAMLWADGQLSEHTGRGVDVVDTVGAGDAFSAAMAFASLRHHKLDEVLDFAVSAATHACTQAGAAMSFPDQVRSMVERP